MSAQIIAFPVVKRLPAPGPLRFRVAVGTAPREQRDRIWAAMRSIDGCGRRRAHRLLAHPWGFCYHADTEDEASAYRRTLEAAGAAVTVRLVDRYGHDIGPRAAVARICPECRGTGCDDDAACELCEGTGRSAESPSQGNPEVRS